MKRAHGGQVIHVTSREQVVAELRPVAAAPAGRRKAGTLKGKIRMAADFDTLPLEMLDAFDS